MEKLIELASVLRQQTDFNEILRIVAQRTSVLMRAEVVFIMMLNPQTRETVKTIIREGREEPNRKYHSVQKQISGWLTKYDQNLLSEDIRKDPRFPHVQFGDLKIKDVAAVVLRVEGVTLGSLIVINKQHDGSFDQDDLDYLDKISVIAVPYLRNVQKLRLYFQAPLPDEALLDKYKPLGLIGKCERFVQLLKTIEAASRSDVRVLLEGESGTGKELVARAIHVLSDRARSPFIAIDCGAIPENLLESELFGHVKGAFTGATATRKGLLEEASGGTLFMDEIANLPHHMQAKLMRVLQENEYRPVGGNAVRKLDVRVISASSRSLRNLVAERAFREDLFYRLYVYPISVPTLDERRMDIGLLASHFLAEAAHRQKKKTVAWHPEIVDFLRERKWSGNIRELSNFVERMVAFVPADNGTIDSSLVPSEIVSEIHAWRRERRANRRPLQEQMDKFQAQVLKDTLDLTNWNQSEAARFLHMSERSIRYRMQKLGVKRPE